MWQGTAMVGKWQICTSIMQLYIDNVIMYMMIQMHIKIGSMLHTLNANKACIYIYICVCVCVCVCVHLLVWQVYIVLFHTLENVQKCVTMLRA